jgi:putative ABC transport system permease protein
MNLIECLILGLTSLRRNPLRSGLTILGIAVGVGAVVSMVSVGDGSRALVLGEIERTGGLTMIEVYKDDWDRQSGTLSRRAGRTLRRWRRNRAEHLETQDLNVILEKARGVVHVVGEDDSGGWNVYHQGISRHSRVVAGTAGYDRSHNWYPIMGRFFTEQEVETASAVTVIGYKLYDEVFKGEDPVGKEIKATRTTSWGPRYDVRLTVIGVLEEKGDAMDTEGWDERFIIPLTTYQQRFTGRKEVERIRVEAASFDDVEIAKEETKRILGRLHNNSGDEYQYWTAQEELATAEKIGNTMKYLMGGIALIALFVAGIGIMNIMLVSVTERTKEIGLRKALGAKRRDILMQFLIEALVLSITGGILGAILGIFLGKGSAALIAKFVWEGSNWPSIISYSTMIIAMGVSIMIGVIFGLYPAYRAAILMPIEALREMPGDEALKIAGQEFKLAPLSGRFCGQLLDSLVYAAIVAIPFGVWTRIGLEGSTIVLWVAVSIALLYLLFQDALNGRSLGKRLMKTQVIDSKSGLPCNLWQSILRNLSLPILSVIDCIFILGEKKQRLGDKLSKTLVVTVT